MIDRSGFNRSQRRIRDVWLHGQVCLERKRKEGGTLHFLPLLFLKFICLSYLSQRKEMRIKTSFNLSTGLHDGIDPMTEEGKNEIKKVS